MAQITLITGGVRSGKSGYAEKIARALPGRRAYLATSPVIDEEMSHRVARHKEQRANDNWITIEEETKIAKVIAESHDFDIILLECLGLWINNLMWQASMREGKLLESDIVNYCHKLKEACLNHPGHIILVTNEVGLGIIPENQQARLFGDLTGRCNQTIAAFADNVILMSCGLPLLLKGELTCR